MSSFDQDTPPEIQEFVWVRRSPQDYRSAKYALDDLANPRWDWLTGGVQRVTPYPMIFAYVSCNGMIEGGVAHTGRHGSCPHNIKVCVVKRDNDPKTYELLAEMAGPKPGESWCTATISHRGAAIWAGPAFSDQDARRRARRTLELKRLPRGCVVEIREVSAEKSSD